MTAEALAEAVETTLELSKRVRRNHKRRPPPPSEYEYEPGGRTSIAGYSSGGYTSGGYTSGGGSSAPRGYGSASDGSLHRTPGKARHSVSHPICCTFISPCLNSHFGGSQTVQDPSRATYSMLASKLTKEQAPRLFEYLAPSAKKLDAAVREGGREAEEAAGGSPSASDKKEEFL